MTPSLFSLLGATPRLGRLFTAADAAEGAPPVVLLSHGAWAGRFGSDPDVVGASFEIEDEAHAVVGVLPEGFEPPLLLGAVLDAAGRDAVRPLRRGNGGSRWPWSC